MDKILNKLSELNYSLPKANTAIAAYVPVKQCGTLIFISGQLPIKDGNLTLTGKITQQTKLEEAQKAAELCALNILAQLYHSGLAVTNLRLSKLTIFVNSGDGFGDIHLVANGASNFFLNLLGEDGKHARSAIGVYGLPLDAAVEVEAIFEEKK